MRFVRSTCSAHGHKRLSADAEYRQALDVLQSGGIVALPTDTVYGLIAVAADRAAVERVYETKARDPVQPLTLFVASIEQSRLIADVTPAAERLAERFWPGALTIVMRKKPAYDTRAAAGGSSIGIRAPDDPIIRELAAQLGPLTGTSANIAGREECHTAYEVRAQLGEAVDLIIDAPLAASGTPSTIVDCTNTANVRILRAGGITRAALAEALGTIATLSDP